MFVRDSKQEATQEIANRVAQVKTLLAECAQIAKVNGLVFQSKWEDALIDVVPANFVESGASNEDDSEWTSSDEQDWQDSGCWESSSFC